MGVGWGDDMKRLLGQYQVLLLLPLLWKTKKTPYDELCRPKRVIVRLPTSHKNINFSNATLRTDIILPNWGCPPPPRKGRTSAYNGLGNKNPITDYQTPLSKYWLYVKIVFILIFSTYHLFNFSKRLNKSWCAKARNNSKELLKFLQS